MPIVLPGLKGSRFSASTTPKEPVMISIEEAKNLCMEKCVRLESISVNVPDSLGYALADDISAPIDLPPFSQSAMDGYAVRCSNDKSRTEYVVLGSSQAGQTDETSVGKGEAIRIFTGAPLPLGANAVVIQERVERCGDQIRIQNPINPRENIRMRGEQIEKGQTILKRGHSLNAATIGLLNAMGMATVQVVNKPRISILVVGDELVTAGANLGPGKIYESNSSMLVAAFQSAGFTVWNVSRVRDIDEDIGAALIHMIPHSDLTVVSGGISVGDYDRVGKALAALGVSQIFYKINQKPGKPIFFGEMDSHLVFALPGNPSASLTCFYEYVYPTVRRLAGHVQHELSKITMPIVSDYSDQGSKGRFLISRFHPAGIEVMERQNSSMLQSFSQAEALVYLPEGRNTVLEGELVEVHLLP